MEETARINIKCTNICITVVTEGEEEGKKRPEKIFEVVIAEIWEREIVTQHRVPQAKPKEERAETQSSQMCKKIKDRKY